MELSLALAATAALGGAPVVLSSHAEDNQRDLEEGALDPDELELGELDDEPLVWDEGADDEID